MFNGDVCAGGEACIVRAVGDGIGVEAFGVGVVLVTGAVDCATAFSADKVASAIAVMIAMREFLSDSVVFIAKMEVNVDDREKRLSNQIHL
jgi:hypothetical protein